MAKKQFLFAFRTSLPVLFGYLALGTAFGLLLVEKKYPVWLAPVMSLIMFAGAGQFIAIGLFAAGAPLSAIVITEFFVNIRHIVYGLSLITKLRGTGKWKPYVIWALTDETYSLLVSTEIPDGMNKTSFYVTVAALDHFYWIAGGVFGSILGTVLTTTTNFQLGGIDFALTALFAVLLIEQILSTKDMLPPAIGAAATTVCIILWKAGILPSSNNILLASLASGIALLMLLRKPAYNDGPLENHTV